MTRPALAVRRAHCGWCCPVLALVLLMPNLACKRKQVFVRPAQAEIAPGGRVLCSALVRGMTTKGWSWSVQEFGAGSVDETGAYQADTEEGTFHVLYTNPLYRRQVGTATIRVVDLAEVVPSKALLKKGEPVHLATPLPDGRILLSGTTTADGHDVELYDPATDTCTQLPSPGLSLFRHTATALLDGRVLLLGSGGGMLFDPATRTFTATGKPTVDRKAHTATLLGNGRVLVTGGLSCAGGPCGANDTFEFFDPADGTFRPGGRMLQHRAGHTATLLPTGQVLLLGGYAGQDSAQTALDDGEIYDPATGTCFALETAMSRKRVFHQALLLATGKVLVLGGCDAAGAPPVVELFDPGTQRFFEGSPMLGPRSWFSALAGPDGKILVAGGDADTLERYDPIKGVFTLLPFRLERLHQEGTLAVLPSGHFWMAGGYRGGIPDQQAGELIR